MKGPILYGLDRFSEDLDFTLLKPNQNFDFSIYLEGMRRELAAFGYILEVAQKSKNVETSVVSAFLKMNTVQFYLSIGEESKAKKTNHNEKIQIKIEIDTDPVLPFRVENHVVLNPVAFNVLTLHKSDLFAGKMHAILFRAWKGRVKGRDWYDLIWYLQNKTPINLAYLEKHMHQAGHLEANETLTKEKLKEMLLTRIQRIDWNNAKADMRTFIADPERLNIWSSSFFSALIDHLLIET